MPPGQDVMISVYNIHHSPAVWDDPEAFKPERFPIDEPVPTEANTDYRHAPLLACIIAYLPILSSCTIRGLPSALDSEQYE